MDFSSRNGEPLLPGTNQWSSKVANRRTDEFRETMEADTANVYNTRERVAGTIRDSPDVIEYETEDSEENVKISTKSDDTRDSDFDTDDSFADVPEIVDDEVSPAGAPTKCQGEDDAPAAEQKTKVQLLPENSALDDATLQLKAKLLDLYRLAGSRMDVQESPSVHEPSFEKRERRVQFTLPAASYQTTPILEGSDTETDESEYDIPDAEDGEPQHVDLGDKMRERNQRASCRMRANTPWALGNILQRNQTPSYANQTQTPLPEETSVSDSNNGVLQNRPSPLGSAGLDNDKDINTQTTSTEEPHDDAATRPPTADLPDMPSSPDEQESAFSYDSAEDRGLPTRCNTRWSDVMDDINAGRPSARPKTSDFFIASESDSEDDDISHEGEDIECADANDQTIGQIRHDTKRDNSIDDEVYRGRSRHTIITPDVLEYEETDSEDVNDTNRDPPIFPKNDTPEDPSNDKSNTDCAQTKLEIKSSTTNTNEIDNIQSSSPVISHFFHDSDEEVNQSAEPNNEMQPDTDQLVPTPEGMCVERTPQLGGGYHGHSSDFTTENDAAHKGPTDTEEIKPRTRHREVYDDIPHLVTASTDNMHNHGQTDKDDGKRSKSGSDINDPKLGHTHKKKKSNTPKQKKKKKTSIETSALMNGFPGNSYMLLDQPILPPIRGEGQDTWRNSPRTSARGFLPDISEDTDQLNATSEFHTKPPVSRRTISSDRLILEKKIATINACNKDYGQKFVPMKSSAFKEPANPALKAFETRSLTVAKFRAQFNRESRLLPALGEINTEDAVLPFEKFENPDKSNACLDIITRAEQKRQKDLEMYTAKLKANIVDTDKLLQDYNKCKKKGKKKRVKHDINSTSYGNIDDDRNILINPYEETNDDVADKSKYANNHMTPFLKRYPGVMSLSINESNIEDQMGMCGTGINNESVIDKHEQIRKYIAQNDPRELKAWDTDTSDNLPSRNVEIMRSKFNDAYDAYEKQANLQRQHTGDSVTYDSEEGYLNDVEIAYKIEGLTSEQAKENKLTPYAPSAPGGDKPNQMRRATRVKLPSQMEQQKLREMIQNTDFMPQAPDSAKPVQYIGRSARILQATGSQHEAITSRQANVPATQTRQPSKTDIMKSKFQRFFRTMVNTDKGQPMVRNRHNC